MKTTICLNVLSLIALLALGSVWYCTERQVSLQEAPKASFLPMRLVEVYGGAIGDQTIQDHATALRQQLGI